MRVETRRFLALLVAGSIALSLVPGTALADQRVGGTVIVEAGETTDDLEVLGGDVVIRGTVDGDLRAVGGNVRIEGTVAGNVEAAGGNVYVGGTVEGDVRGAAGHVQIAEGATIGGDLEAGAGSILIAGTVAGNVRVGAESITLAPTARLGGDLTYEGTLDRQSGAQVAGTVTQTTDLVAGPFPKVAGIVFSVYFLLANLLLGAILLLAFPRFSDGLVTRTRDRPGLTGLVGLAVLVGGPLALVLVALTIVGIPLALVGIGAYVLAIWVGVVYGRFLLGAWLLSIGDFEHRWLALLVGLLVVFAIQRVPVVGAVADLAVTVWGLGALAMGLYAAYRRGRFGGGADEDVAAGASEASPA